MAPRRSGRRNVSPYKKGDYIEYNYKGNTVTGKIFKKSSNGTEASPMWIVTPSDRRRRNEEVPEKALGKIINAQEAMSNRGPKLKKVGNNKGARESPSPTSGNSNSDGSVDEPQAPISKRGGQGSPTEENSKASGSVAAGKRKSDDSNSDRANTNGKTVTFSQESNGTATASKKQNKIKNKVKKASKKTISTRIGTRSSRGPGEMVLLPDLPVKRKGMPKGKKVNKDEHVTVVKMLTGTLYLYRGDRRRAEFVRFK